MARIVCFGSTGYTGRLVAAELVRRGARPVLAGRDRAGLDELAGELGGLETAVADAASPESVAALIGRGDVLVSTVGPFTRHGEPAVRAAIERGAVYIDSTGEPPFIRRVFEEWSPAAEAAGATLLTAFGYDFVPGNVAAAVACRAGGDSVRRVDVGYFITGGSRPSAMSSGTRASLAAVATEPAFALRRGRVQTLSGPPHVRSFTVEGRARSGVGIGASEHFCIPRVAPTVDTVNVYLGWFGPLSRAVQVAAAATGAVARAPGGERVIEAVRERLPNPGTRTGPGPEERARSGSDVVAIAYDAADHAVAAVRLRGVNGYDFTGRIMAWAAQRAAEGAVTGRGALGPVEAFGIDAITGACTEVGLPVTEELAGAR